MKYSIIVPFWERFEHLAKLVPHLRSYAERKGLDMEIIIAEQADSEPLRRGALRNEGAKVATGDVFIFHDVDYLPADNVDYWPLYYQDVHRSIKRVEFVTMDMKARPENDTPAGYRTFKDGIDDKFFGGALSITREAFNKTNGYNPLYRGWGLEDDDFRERIYRLGLRVNSAEVGTFLALPHPDSYKGDELFQHNQRLFANRVAAQLVGTSNTTVQSTMNDEKCVKYGVDKWIESTKWEAFDPTSLVKHQPRIAELDYGVFALLDNVAGDHIQKEVAAGKRWEPGIMALCEKYTKPGTTVFDIGANIGTFTVRLSQLVGPRGNVKAYEPQRIIHQQLCANIFLNGLRNVRAYPIAIGRREEEVTLTPIDYDNGAPGEVRIHGNEGQTAMCIALDKAIEIEEDISEISLIKIDVERYEPFVFDGAQKTIEKHRPVLLFELTTLPLPDYPEDYVVKMLNELNYNIYKVSEWGDYLGLPKEIDDNV